MIDRVQLFGLASQLEDRTRTFFRLEPRVRGFSFDLDREDSGPLPARFHAASGRGRLHHKRAPHRLSFCHLFDEGPA